MSDINDQDIYDPSIKRYSQYNDTDALEDSDDNSEFGSRYLETLYSDYLTKVKSAKVYLKKIEEQQTKLTDTIEAWTSLLKEKYKLLDNFQSQQKMFVNNSNFALEDRSPLPQTDNTDIKKIDTAITDNSEQINYHFMKLEDYINFLSRTYLDAQETVNKVYDRFMEMYQNM